jgi:UDP-N-acetyl-D-glucosamine dehydrogenase
VYHDPYVPELQSLGLRHTELADAVEGADLAAIVTAHPGVDHELVVASTPAVVDFRGVTRHLQSASVVQL